MSEKRCSKCRTTKPKSAFTRDASTTDGLRFWCKDCDRTRKKLYAEKRRAVGLSVYRSLTRGIRKPDPNRRARDIRYRQAHKEQLNATRNAWRRRNPDHVVAMRHRNRMRKTITGTGISSGEIDSLFAASLGICAYCNERKPLTLDHIEPLAGGGLHEIDNAAAACRSCNAKKNATTLVVWLAKRAMHQLRAA